MIIRDDGSRSYKILYGIGKTIQFLILKPIGFIFTYIGKLLSEVAKSIHNRLVNWLGIIGFAFIVSLLVYLFKR
jgi:hypothetical protein